MDLEQLQKLGQSFGTIMLIAGIGVLGMVLILAILIVWRRGHRRMRKLEAQRDQARQEQPIHIDTWSSAAQRLEVDSPKPNPPDDNEDWDEDPDDNAPWRESLGELPDFGEADEEDEEDDEEQEDEDER